MNNLREIRREELAWAAGFFDGEGNIRVQKADKEGGSDRIRMTVTQIDPRPLERFRAAVFGLGSIYGPYDQRRRGYERRRPIWHWHASSFEHAQAAVAALWPFLCPVKRDQAHAALSTYTKQQWKWAACQRAGHRVVHEGRRHYCADCRNKWRPALVEVAS